VASLLAPIVAPLTGPGRVPPLKAVIVGLLLLAVPLGWWTALSLAGLRFPAPGPSPFTLTVIVTVAVLLAPLFETAVLVVLHWLMVVRFQADRSTFVLAAVATAVVAHTPLTLVRTPVTAAIFVVFALVYAGWFAARGWRTAFIGAALAHAAYNAGSLALSPVFAMLLRPG
jgi:hypothetical protein